VTLLTEEGSVSLSALSGANVYKAVRRHLKVTDPIVSVTVSLGETEIEEGVTFEEEDIEDNARLTVQIDLNTDSAVLETARCKEWSQLNPVETRGAMTLGYTSLSWSGSKDWEELSQGEKNAAQVLGYDANCWNNNAPVPAERLDWARLGGAQRTAAAMLGHDRFTWDRG